MFGYYFDLALRSLGRNKALTALMVLAIALGIGASMTTLTVLHVLSGDPLPDRSSRLYAPQLDPRDMSNYCGFRELLTIVPATPDQLTGTDHCAILRIAR